MDDANGAKNFNFVRQTSYVSYAVVALLFCFFPVVAARPHLVRLSVDANPIENEQSDTNPQVIRYLIDLNSATKDDLTNLPDIGEKTAERILEYRDSRGGFSSVDDLLNVRGIGEKTLEKIRPYCQATSPEEELEP